MAKYLQGAAFYLFVYLMLGLINSGIMYAFTKFLHIYPTVTLGLLVFLSIFVLYFGFKKSVQVAFGTEVEEKRLIISWMVQFISFLTVATLIEAFLGRLVPNTKLFQVLSVFVNFITFFLTYWLSVKLIVLRGKVEA